jgi:hypothetical protein
MVEITSATDKHSRRHLETLGKKFSKLIPIRLFKVSCRSSPYRFEAVCDCGNTTKVRTSSLYSGKTTSCGCAQLDAASRSGGTSTTGNPYRWLYRFWVSVRYRTTKVTNPNYKYYKDRAPEDREWQDFNEFKSMFIETFERKYGRSQPLDGESLDRIDNDKAYSLDNLRFASAARQVRNRRNTLYLVTGSNSKIPLSELWEKLNTNNVTYGNFVHRFTKAGWTLAHSLEVDESSCKGLPEYYPRQS